MGPDREARPRLPLPLPPDVFAIVMATGIVAVAATDHAYGRIATALGLIASTAFCALLIGVAAGICLLPRRIITEMRDPDVAFRMFTFVAACGVLAARWEGHTEIVWVLAALALLAWLILVPLSILDVRSRESKDLRDHAHGAWLLPSVATESLAILAADLSIHSAHPVLLVFGVVALITGIVIYVTITGLIVWRGLTTPRVPEEVTPDSWILMGALAITTLAASHLLDAAAFAGSARWAITCLRPLTLVVWIVASAWIPLVLYAEVWRVDSRAGSLQYQGVWWAAVFPLGMYAAASHATSVNLNMPSLDTISLVFFWVATTVWLIVAVGLVHRARSNCVRVLPLGG